MQYFCGVLVLSLKKKNVLEEDKTILWIFNDALLILLKNK